MASASGESILATKSDNNMEPKRKRPCSGAGSNKRPNYQRHLKLPDTYCKLITMAITNSKNKMVTLHEIQAFLKERYSCFNGSYVGWKNSLRHNLSANPVFVKVLRDGGKPRGKDNYWTIQECTTTTTTVKLENGEERERKEDVQVLKLEVKQENKNTDLTSFCNATKVKTLSFSIDNLLRPSPKKRKYSNSNLIAENVPKRPSCHRVQVRQPAAPATCGAIWRRQKSQLCTYEYYSGEDRLPVCYSERFRIEELRCSRLSIGGVGGSRRPSTFVGCELEGCELNHQDDFIVCELDNCKVCKPWLKVRPSSPEQRPGSNAYEMNPPLQSGVLSYPLDDYERSCTQTNEAHIDFSAYEIDPERLENLRETLEVQACGGVKAARIREED